MVYNFNNHKDDEVFSKDSQNDEGRRLNPRILTPDRHTVKHEGEASQTTAGAEGVVVAITFLEAADLAEALRIAESHPGRHYGVSIEVREWTFPVPQPTPIE